MASKKFDLNAAMENLLNEINAENRDAELVAEAQSKLTLTEGRKAWRCYSYQSRLGNALVGFVHDCAFCADAGEYETLRAVCRKAVGEEPMSATATYSARAMGQRYVLCLTLVATALLGKDRAEELYKELSSHVTQEAWEQSQARRQAKAEQSKAADEAIAGLAEKLGLSL